MTNEEARQWFLKVYSEIKGKGYADENEEAYELAIKALEKVSNLEKICEELADMPCITPEEMQKCKDIVKKYTPKQEPCDDAISRQAVLNEFYDVENLYERIKRLPSVRPQEPKTGHWIIIDDCEKFIAKCSKCGRIEDSRMISKYPYCHCGAKMVEPQESEVMDE